MSLPVIRPILKKDNPQIARVIRTVLEEFESTEPGTTYTDTILDSLYEFYQQPRSSFYVLENDNRIIGGGGIAQLGNFDGNICELQKMYFAPQARGKGLGKAILELCLRDASLFRYEKMYLETLSRMKGAQQLYQKYGFEYLDHALGDTGHFYCGVHMLKDMTSCS